MTPRIYHCLPTGPIPITGDLNKPEWLAAEWTEDFIDISTDVIPRHRTRVKMLWDETNFYIAAELEEPHVWGTLTERDSVIFQDNDFEVFIDPDGDNHNYLEIEVNALGTVWDLLLTKPYRDQGMPVNCFDTKGMQVAVQVQGTLNDPSDIDQGWTVEMAIPWKALSEITKVSCPPKPGDCWRVNFSRVEWDHTVVEGRYVKVPGVPEYNWVWSPQHAIDMHRPEHWGVVCFGDSLPDLSAEFEAREVLMRVYWAQRAFREAHGRWGSASELGLSGVEIFCTPSLYEAVLGEWRLSQDSRIWREGR